ncbi:hypothetical protein [Comamonas sp. B21-038]|uniref:hypothetical protein n=1 Tax=Comamonas sp. B21-038 TaxID=2918299 RepID=UPI001EFB07CD|nr:hypothetical protein [Comamonas sp. B21-038]ULR91316.1 hypothetical protein MJ205_10965 [Comamonas sp. B21-038]
MNADKSPSRARRVLPGLALALASMLVLSACDRDKADSAFPVPKVPPPPAEPGGPGATYPGAGSPERGSNAARVDAQGHGATITGKDPDLGVTPKAPDSGAGGASAPPASSAAPSDNAASGGAAPGGSGAVPDGSTPSAPAGGGGH